MRNENNDDGARPVIFEEMFADGGAAVREREIAIEAPVAIEVGGLAYAVMMATPSDLEDFAVGFALSEGLIGGAADLADVWVRRADAGQVVRLTLSKEKSAPVMDRLRRGTAGSSCGLCGVARLEAVFRPLPPVPRPRNPDPEAVFAALGALRSRQDLGARTRAVHGAAFCDPRGTIGLLREDVGRHNALDKLIGAGLRGGRDLSDGFVLLTSRCSYELVEKAVAAGLSALVTVSAPTSLALDRAAQAGLPLVVLARDDSVLAASR